MVPFLERHCYECHDEDVQKNEVRLDTLGFDLSEPGSLRRWQAVLDQLNLGEMPPAEQPQPAAQAAAGVVDTLTAALREAYESHRGGGDATVIRRLNRFELRNTIRDLLSLDGPEFEIGNTASLVDNNGNGRVQNTSRDPFRHFPDDEEEGGFDNIGSRLVMSDFFLKLMLEAAEESLLLATAAREKPELKAPRIDVPITEKGNWSQSAPGPLELYQRQRGDDFEALYRRYWRFGRLRPDAWSRGVGASGRYRVTVEASAHHQRHPWGDVVDTDQDERLVLGLHLVSHRNENSSRGVRSWELPADGKRRSYSTETWIDGQWLPWIGWENGPEPKAVWADPILKRYLPELHREAPDRRDREAYEAWLKEQADALLDAGYRGPHLRIYSIALEPLDDLWPPAGHRLLYGDGDLERDRIEPLLRQFASRAFRRPVAAEEISPYAKLVRSRWGEPETAKAGISGLRYRVYDGKWSKLPDFDQLEPAAHGELGAGLIDIRPARRAEHYGMVFQGTIDVPGDGEYQFAIASDDGSRITVGEQVAVVHDGLHGASTKRGTVVLEAGAHPLRVDYFAYGQPNSLRMTWSGPGFADVPLSVGQGERPTDVDSATAHAMAALRVGYAAILCSPEFLYLQEGDGPLDGYAIASRLSYFLWSSMPDPRLMELAAAGQLQRVDVIEAEVERMLDDPKAAAFSRHFTERWLRLDKIKDSPPERSGPFRVYHDRQLERHLIAQTDAYFADLVKRDAPVREIIDSDHTFLNEPVADIFYGRGDVRGEFLRKVPTNDRRRGGMLTQPAVMTATANGVDTSPVVRGSWLLENILGTPPAPPPPDVEPLSPDLRGTTTIREQLAAHREVASCNNCHQKIDPMGFPFENFNPIGQWRDRYRKINQPIDASAELRGDRRATDIVEFKSYLLEREEQVARCLIEKMLTYATGRSLGATDRGEVERILAELRGRDGGVRELIRLVATSETFLTK